MGNIVMEMESWKEFYDCANEVVLLLFDEPIAPEDSSSLPKILSELKTIHCRLVTGINNAPFPVSLNEKGDLEKCGEKLAGFASYLQLVCCLYHGMDRLNASMLPDALRNFASLRLSASVLSDHITAKYF